MGATARNVDMSNVKDQAGFNRSRIKAGDYLAKIIKVEDAVAKDKTDQYLFTIQIVDKPSSKFPYYCKLQDNQLWKLRNIFIAAGKTVPKKKVKVDPNQIVGKVIGVTVEDDEYEGKEQSTIEGVFPASELGDYSAPSGSASDDDDEDSVADDGEDLDLDLDEPAEEEAAAEEAEEAEEAAEEADPYADLDRTALKARIKEHQPDAKFLKSQTDDDLREVLRKIESTAPAKDDDDLEDLDIDDI